MLNLVLLRNPNFAMFMNEIIDWLGGKCKISGDNCDVVQVAFLKVKR